MAGTVAPSHLAGDSERWNVIFTNAREGVRRNDTPEVLRLTKRQVRLLFLGKCITDVTWVVKLITNDLDSFLVDLRTFRKEMGVTAKPSSFLGSSVMVKNKERLSDKLVKYNGLTITNSTPLALPGQLARAA